MKRCIECVIYGMYGMKKSAESRFGFGACICTSLCGAYMVVPMLPHLSKIITVGRYSFEIDWSVYRPMVADYADLHPKRVTAANERGRASQ